MSGLALQSDVETRRHIMATGKRQDWRALCQEVSTEHNSQRLQVLLAELLKSLDEPTTSVLVDTSTLAVRT